MSGTGIVIGNFVGGATAGGAGSSTPPITPGFNPLTFRIDTNYIVGSNDYTLGVDASGTYDFTVNWGDGQSDVITSPTQPEITHSYSGAGARTISITPNQAYSVDHWSFGRRSSSIASAALTDIFSFGDIKFYANEDIFYECKNFNTVANRAGVPNFQNRNIIDGFFFRNDSLGTTTEPDFSGWGTFTGTGIQFMRGSNISPFSSSRVNVNFSFTPTSLREAFFNQILFNSPLSNWTVSSCDNFNQTFALASAFNRPLNWTFSTDVSVDISAVEMFKDALAFNQDISSWNTSRFTDTSSMFQSGTPSVFNQDISSWNTDSITNASFMFRGASAFTSDLSNWFSSGSLANTAAFTGGVNGIFYDAVSFDGDVDGWDTSNLTCLINSFRGTTSFNKSLSTWDVGNVLFFVDSFKDAKLFTGLGLPGWDTSSAVSFSGMFNGASAFNQDLSSWDISSLTSAADMLTGTAISQSNWDRLLIGWATQAPNIQNNVTLSDIPVLHSAGKPKNAYDRLVSAPYNWTITDLGGAAPPPSFSFTIDTTSTETGSSAANQYRLPLMSTGTYDFYVNWGDGTLGDQITTWNQSEATHTYASSGTYTISIQAVSLSGGTPSIDHISWASQDGTTLSTANDRLKVQDITAWGNAVIYLNEYVFSTCNNLDITTTAEPTFGSRVLRSDTFNDCSSLAGDISSWGTQAPITGDASIFYQNGGQNPNVNFNAQLTGSLFVSFSGASNFNSSLSNWNVSSVTSLSRTFQNASSFNQNIATWDVSSVSSLSNTFNGATAFDQDLSNWSVGNVTTASNMFTNSGLSAANWDALLIGWAAQGTVAGSLQSNVTLSNINQYHGTVDAAATAAYNKLTGAPYNWNIVDLGVQPTSAFEFDIDTTQIQLPGSTANNQYRLPLMSTGNYNFTVNWGDGQSNSIATWNQADATHTYASSGIYSISITGTIDHVSWSSQDGTTFTQANDRKKVKDITDWGSAVIYLDEMVFFDCENMDITTTAAPTFGSKVMRDDQFFDCNSFTGDISAWGTVASPITGSVNSFLSNAGNANPNVNFVYQRTSSSLFRALYQAFNFNKPLDNWDVAGSGGNCTDAFYFCLSFNQDISGWDMSGANSMTRMFSGATVFNQNISTWDVSGVGSFNSMFRSASAFNQPIGSWTTTALDDLRSTFDSASSFNQDLSNWDTSSVDDMQSTFEDATAFNQDLSSWDVSSLSTATNMFTNSGLSAENWDKLLIGWAAQGTGAGSLQANVTLSNINQLHGSVDSAAIAAYNKLVAAPYSWTIVDLGAAVVGNLLLDTSYGSGAEAAYSVRKLRTAYTGPAMQVQDTVGGGVQDIYFDANDNLDEAAIVSYGGSNTVVVAKWYDQSGNGNDAIQNSSGNRPTIYTGGAINEAVYFEAGDVLALATGADITSSFLVARVPNISQGAHTAASGSNPRWWWGGSSLNGIGYKGDGGAMQSGVEDNVRRLQSVFVGDSTDRQLIDGTQTNTDNNQGVQVLTHLGASYNNTENLRGYLYEFIGYNVDKYAVREDIQQNIGDYFTQNTPLLDTYSGAAAAYSLRLLRTAYTGLAIQVQRADNVGGTTDIGFNVFGELDTVSLAQVAAGNDMVVAKWYDQSGNSNDATQGTSLNRPKIYDGQNGVVTENGKPAVEFDSKVMQFNSINAQSSFVTINSTAVSSNPAMIGNSSTTNSFGFYSASGGGVRYKTPTNYDFGSLDNLGYNLNSFVITDLLSLTVFQSGSAATEGSVSVNSIASVNQLMARTTTYLQGNLQEVIIYSSDQSAYRTDIEDNINTFYDIYTEPVAPLLLNNYPGAAAAYSLRRINSSYQGSAVLVQTANNTKQPVYIGFDSNNDLDTVSLAAYGGSEDVVVAGWFDQSGNGNNAEQTASANRPKIYDGSTGVIVDTNGKPQIEHRYLSQSQFVLRANVTYSGSDLSVFCVYENDGSNQWPLMADLSIFIPDGTLLQSRQNRLTSYRSAFATGTAQTQSRNVGVNIWNGSNLTGYINGTAGTSDTSNVGTTAFNFTTIELLNGITGDGNGPTYTSELILYTSAQSSSNRTDIEENIGGYYDIPLPGLLDENPGAAAAYSLRRLTNTYTGSAIQVQRADNVGGTHEIGFDSYGDLDTAALTTAAQGNDMVVVTWYDQSGNSNDTTQGTSLNRPKIYDGQNGVVTENGKPAVEFDGAGDRLLFDNNVSTSNTEWSIFDASKVGGDGHYIYFQGGADGTLSFNLVKWAYIYTGVANAGTPITAETAQTQHSHLFASSTVNLYVNSSLNQSVASFPNRSFTGASTARSIGGRSDSSRLHTVDGTISEVIFYSTDQSSNRTNIETNIGGYYDIALPGLLDENPGAAAAYSLRRLSSTYTGSAIQVQRADNVGGTHEIGFDSYGELDTAALTTAAQGNDMVVVTWYDQSGNSNDATQISSGARPKIYDGQNGVVEENGKPAVSFLDIGDILASSSATEFNSVLQNELYCVASYGTINVGNQYAAGVQIGGSGRGIMIGTNSSGDDIRYHCDGSTFEVANGGTITVDTQILHGGTYDGTTRHARLNGASVGTNTDAGNTGTANVYFIGKHPSFTVGADKKVQEFILYPAYGGNETNIEENIGGYYDIPLAGLLDENPGAAAAYSLRRLSSTYTGSAIQVQRADNVGGTHEIGFDSYGELDTTALRTAAQGNDMVVVTWYDQSGNSNDATQISSGSRPKIYDGQNGVVEENGKPSVEFDGSNDGLIAGQSLGITTTDAAIFVTYTVDASANGTLFSLQQASAAGVRGQQNNATNYRFEIKDPSGNVTLQMSDTAGQKVKSHFLAPNSQEIFSNGLNVKSSTTAYADYHFYTPKIGFRNNDSYFLGKVQEFVVYDSNESSNRTDIEGNIGGYYDIPLAGLLDENPGAAAAYSLRRLSSTYTGSAVQVQRADNVGGTTDIGFDSYGELDTTALTTAAQGNDMVVAKWYDQSGNSNDAEQTSSSARPKIYDGTTGVVTENGKPAVEFDGSNDFLPIASNISVTANSIHATITRKNEIRVFFGDAQDWLATWTSSEVRTQEGSNKTVTKATGQVLYSHIYDGTNSASWSEDGTSLGSTIIGSQTLTYNNIGGFSNYYHSGNFQELIIYPSDQDAAGNRSNIETNINTFYDIY